MSTKNSHPGLELNDILSSNNITQRDFAAKIGITLSLLNSILKGTRNINVNIAISLEVAGYGKATQWMEKQINFLINETKNNEEFTKKTTEINIWKELEEIIPVNYFKKEGIIKNDISEDINSIFKVYNVDNINDFKHFIKNYNFKHFRKSPAFEENKNNVIAWSMLAEYNASQIKAKPFDKDKELLLIDELKKCFFRNHDTIDNTKKILLKYGIKFLILDRPGKTPVDGKSFMSNDNPTIVLTLKYNRLDNFAFTIMHELGHVFKHFTKPKYKHDSFFVITSNTEQEEFEANTYARDHLISQEIWDDFLYSNFEYDDRTIIDLSRRIKVHPGIIRGRLCFQYPEYYSKRSIINRLNLLQ
ncbi:MAG: ImmA/IrrE family metallo-endopeptidase [Flavobacterium sp.]|jgi:HTH-type transcriptional regulator/antitoxin HigA